MYKYHILLAFRRMIRNKVLSAINIFGLSVGIACCIFMFLYVYDELQFDKGSPHSERLYRVYGNNFGHGQDWMANQPNKLFEQAIEDIPEIERGTIIDAREFTICFKNSLIVEKYAYTDSSVFDVLGWKLLVGNPHEVLKNAFTLVISESTAKKLYGSKNPIGEQIRLNTKDRFTITGIFQDVPKHTHVTANFLTSKATRDSASSGENHWGNFSSNIYLRLKPNSNPNIVSNKLTNVWMAKADKGQYKEPGTALKLQPFQDIYLHSNNIYQAGYNKNGNYWTLISLSAIGILILIIACFNFLNLSMAQNSERGVEVGIRKTFGAGQIEIYKQILIENSVFVIISLNISLILVNLFVPWFNNFISKELSLAGALPYIFYFITIVIIFIIICTAFYPSFVLANFETVTVLKGKINLFDSKNWLYKTFHENISKWLVTLQFTISVCLIICALFIIKQLHFIRTFDVGFDKSQIMVIYNTWDGKQDSRFDIIKNMCAQMPEVEMVSSGCNVPTDGYNNSCNPTLLNNPNIKANAGLISVDYNYLSCIGAHLIDGRNFNPLLVSDSSAIIITKSCVKELGLTDPIGEWVENLWDGRKREIVGVVNDINFNTLHIKSQPLIFLAHHKWMTNRTKILIKFKSRNFAIVKSKLEAKWKELCPEEIFGYFFMDDKFEANYHDDNNNAFLINIFTSLSILLCIMGLAGLVMFTVQKRSKEIGIRKVNGANTFEIIGLINKDFLISIAIAFIIGSPIAYYIINLWLRNFAYRTTLDWWVFVFAFAVAMLISIITTSLQSWHVATRNPVESLKYE